MAITRCKMHMYFKHGCPTCLKRLEWAKKDLLRKLKDPVYRERNNLP